MERLGGNPPEIGFPEFSAVWAYTPSLSIRFRRLPDPDDIALLCLRVRHDEKGVFQLSSSRFERLDFGLVIAHISEISIPSHPNPIYTDQRVTTDPLSL